MKTTRFFAGLDLGLLTDPSALVILERPVVTAATPPADRRPVYRCRFLKRWKLGTPYPSIVEEVAGLLEAGELQQEIAPELTADATGVGAAVVGLFRDRFTNRTRCRFRAVTITAGHSIGTSSLGGATVPKSLLIGRLQTLLQTRRLQVSRHLDEADTLAHELERFRLKVTAETGHETYNARGRDHDDMVLALALAAWGGEQELPPLAVRRGPTRIRV